MLWVRFSDVSETSPVRRPLNAHGVPMSALGPARSGASGHDWAQSAKAWRRLLSAGARLRIHPAEGSAAPISAGVCASECTHRRRSAVALPRTYPLAEWKSNATSLRSRSELLSHAGGRPRRYRLDGSGVRSHRSAARSPNAMAQHAGARSCARLSTGWGGSAAPASPSAIQKLEHPTPAPTQSSSRTSTSCEPTASMYRRAMRSASCSDSAAMMT